MKSSLVISFLCILALSYLIWTQRMETLMLTEDVTDLRGKLAALEPKPRAPRKPATAKETK